MKEKLKLLERKLESYQKMGNRNVYYEGTSCALWYIQHLKQVKPRVFKRTNSCIFQFTLSATYQERKDLQKALPDIIKKKRRIENQLKELVGDEPSTVPGAPKARVLK